MKSRLEKFRTRWLRWLGQKTRDDKNNWVELLNCNWTGWATKVIDRVGLDMEHHLSPFSSRREVYYYFQTAIYEADMEDLRVLDHLYCTELVERPRRKLRGDDVKINNGKHTNIDRLHDVLEGRIQGRGCGKTMLLCHQIAGQLEIAPQDMMVLIPSKREIDYFMPVLIFVLEEHEFVVNQIYRNTLHILQTDTKIELCSSNRLQNESRGQNSMMFWEN